MTIKYLKKSPKTSSTDDNKTKEIVEGLLNDLEKSKEEGCKDLTKKFDKYEGEIIVSKDKIQEIKRNLDQKTIPQPTPGTLDPAGTQNCDRTRHSSATMHEFRRTVHAVFALSRALIQQLLLHSYSAQC